MSDAFYNALCDHQHFEGYEEGYKDGYEAGKRDAVVRCGECKWYGIYYAKKDGTPDKRYRPSVCLRGKYAKRRDPDWFCADGERREG